MVTLMCASYTGCLESTELLLMSGADHLVEGPQGLTATKIAVHSGHNDIADLIQAIEFSQSSTHLTCSHTSRDCYQYRQRGYGNS